MANSNIITLLKNNICIFEMISVRHNVNSITIINNNSKSVNLTDLKVVVLNIT